MAAKLSRTLRERAQGRGGVAVLVMLEPGSTMKQRQACARWLRGKAKKRRLYAELDLITATLGDAVLVELAARDEVATITAAPKEKPKPVINRRKVSQKHLDELIEVNAADKVPAASTEWLDETAAEMLREEEVESVAVAAASRAVPFIGPEPGGSRAWGINDMRIPPLWAEGIVGQGVVVAHLDTGAREDHVALCGRIAHRAVIDEQGRYHATSEMGDRDGHGTHTAATICGQPVGKARVGVAPWATLACARVIDDDGVSTPQLLRGLQWVLQKRTEEDVNIRVLNLSLGYLGWEPAFRAVLAKIQDADILTVASVGNDGYRTSHSPGNYKTTLAVGAYDRDDEVWDRSSSNTWASGRAVPDLVAPGVEITSADASDRKGLCVDRGTSMATAYVSGLAALLFSHRADATAKDIKEAILKSCRPLRDVATSREGRGWPDAGKAREALDKTMANKPKAGAG